jgi:GTPase SAR1 family protein
MESPPANPKLDKIILLGDTATGKSSFLKNYSSNARTRASIPTVNF